MADRLPELILDALHVANTVAHGIHGRRRAGTGETFWQFRQFQASDPATVIDWRRSASSDNLYVREREWEAAHTFWLWPDISPSMAFRSHLAPISKRDRALVLTLAMAELLVRAGERIALHRADAADGEPQGHLAHRRDAGRARGRRGGADEPAAAGALVAASRARCCSAISSIRPKTIAARLNEMAEGGVTGHLVQILDPAEETLAYEGRMEFRSPEGSERWVADRVETLRPEYQKKLAAHRAKIEEAAHRIGWSFLVHHTDRPAAEPLLTLIMRLQGMAGDYRWKPADCNRAGGAP